MTTQQLLAFAVLGIAMGLFIWGRLRYDLVAVIALIAAVLVGVVPAKEAFSGFGNDILVIVASALVVSAAVARSGVVEGALLRISPAKPSIRLQIALLVGGVMVLSTFVKNIGALAILMPVAFQMARRAGTSPSCVLMPMAFGSLLGGLVTLVGTSPNVIVAGLREEMTGRPFQMFDFAPVGLVLAAAGFAFLLFGYRLLPHNRAGAVLGEALDIRDYTTEATVAAGSPAVGGGVDELVKLAQEPIEVLGVVRDRGERRAPDAELRLKEGDLLLLKGEPAQLERAVARARLELEAEKRPVTAPTGSEVMVVEAVLSAGSPLVARTAGRVDLYERFGVNLVAVSRQGARLTSRLRDVRLAPGDVIMLQGAAEHLPGILRDLGALPLAGRDRALGKLRNRLLPLGILFGAIALTAAGVLPVSIAFFSAAALMVLTGALTLREAYDSIEWPILVLFGALIPVSDALQATGGADLISAGLSQVATDLPVTGALALIMAVAMALTPFLNNAATVLVMAPIAAGFATDLGYRPDAFLMAVAVGAACDFLTPIGHQCNTLVMGPGGYRFGDYWKLGLPLSVIVVALGVPTTIAWVWPVS